MLTQREHRLNQYVRVFKDYKYRTQLPYKWLDVIGFVCSKRLLENVQWLNCTD